MVLGGVRQAAFLVFLPLSSFFAGVTLTAVSLGSNQQPSAIPFLHDDYDYEYDTIDRPCFDLVQVCNETALLPAVEEAEAAKNTTIMIDLTILEHVTLPETTNNQPYETVEHTVPVNRREDLLETTPNSLLLDVELSTATMKETSFSVTTPSSFADMFGSIVDTAASNYQDLQAFVHYVNATSVEELMVAAEAAVAQGVEDFFEKVVRLYGIAKAAWEVIPECVRYWVQVLSSIYQMRSLIRWLLRTLCNSVVILCCKIFVKIDARFGIRDRVMARVLLRLGRLDRYVWDRWGCSIGIKYFVRTFHRLAERDKYAILADMVVYLARLFPTAGDDEELAHRTIINLLLNFWPVDLPDKNNAILVTARVLQCMTPNARDRFIRLVIHTDIALHMEGTQKTKHFTILSDVCQELYLRGVEQRAEEQQQQQQQGEQVEGVPVEVAQQQPQGQEQQQQTAEQHA